MTVVAAWIRKTNNLRNLNEIVMVSDSRLNGTYFWDECPKLMKLERKDCILGFAGNTDFSYPIMLQMNNAICEYRKAKVGAMSVNNLAGHLVRVINDLTKGVENQVVCQEKDKLDFEPYSNEYIFAGYDWMEQKFVIKPVSCVVKNINKSKTEFNHDETTKLIGKSYSYQELKYGITSVHVEYDEKQQKIRQKGNIYFENFKGRFGEIAVIGDKREELLSELEKVLKSKYGENYEGCINSKFDMEPYDAISNLLIRESSEEREKHNLSTIGGAPQMLKVYQYMKSGVIGVYWPNKDKNNPFVNRTLLGRKLFDYEDTEYMFWDQKERRAFPCKSGMNTYIDMFKGLKFKFKIVNDNKIRINIICDNTKEYSDYCSYSVINETKPLAYNSKFKVKLSYLQDGQKNLKVFPMWDIKEYYIPDEEAFAGKNEFETGNQFTDMFEGVNFNYKITREGKVRPILYVKPINRYASLCSYKLVNEKDYNFGDTFDVTLRFNKKGIEWEEIEPYMYKKRFKIPKEKEINKYIALTDTREKLAKILFKYKTTKE